MVRESNNAVEEEWSSFMVDSICIPGSRPNAKAKKHTCSRGKQRFWEREANCMAGKQNVPVPRVFSFALFYPSLFSV